MHYVKRLAILPQTPNEQIQSAEMDILDMIRPHQVTIKVPRNQVVENFLLNRG